jgi:hypothetical protein
VPAKVTVLSQISKRGWDDTDDDLNGHPAGGLREQEVIDGIASAGLAMSECYSQALSQNPSLAGRIKVKFNVVAGDQGGSLENATILSSEINSPFLEMCILKALSAVQFPAPVGSNGEAGVAIVAYVPFVFYPSAEYGTSTSQPYDMNIFPVGVVGGGSQQGP